VVAQQIEQQQTLYQKALAELQAAEAALQSAKLAADFQQRLAKRERETAEAALSLIGKGAPLGSLQQQVQAAERRLQRAEIRAPIDGVVLRVMVEAGELAGQKPILQLANLQKMICVAEVAHDQAQYVKKGQAARIHSKAFGNGSGPLQGTVVYRSPLAGSPDLQPVDPFAPTDRMTMQVRVELDEASSQRAADFVNSAQVSP
jgi:HlyD family secretion protein